MCFTAVAEPSFSAIGLLLNNTLRSENGTLEKCVYIFAQHFSMRHITLQVHAGGVSI